MRILKKNCSLPVARAENVVTFISHDKFSAAVNPTPLAPCNALLEIQRVPRQASLQCLYPYTDLLHVTAHRTSREVGGEGGRVVKGGRQVQCKLTKTRFVKSMLIQLIKSGKEQRGW